MIYNWVMSIKKHCARENVIVDLEEEEIDDRQRRTHEQRLNRGKSEQKNVSALKKRRTRG